MLAKGLLRQLQECQTKLQQETAACQELRQRVLHDENRMIARERETLAKEQEVIFLVTFFPFVSSFLPLSRLVTFFQAISSSLAPPQKRNRSLPFLWTRVGSYKNTHAHSRARHTRLCLRAYTHRCSRRRWT